MFAAGVITLVVGAILAPLGYYTHNAFVCFLGQMICTFSGLCFGSWLERSVPYA